MNTKERIIDEALKLFSINGFDSVSTRDITRALGMADSGIYKHFKSKQEILDSIIEKCKKIFIEQVSYIDLHKMEWDDLNTLCLNMFKFQTENETIVMFRRLLVIEQYKNPLMQSLYRNFFINMEVENTCKILTELIKEGYVVDLDPYVLAMELYAPFFMYHMNAVNKEELYERLKKHIDYFRRNYRIRKEEK